MPDAVAPTETPPPATVPVARPVNPFENNPREDAILRERLATIDDTISGEELTRRVTEAVRAKLAGR